VLDFVNKPAEILQSFQPYYRTAQLEKVTDPNLVHELMTKLNKVGVYFWTEVEPSAEAFYDPKKKTQAALHAVLNPAFDRFQALEGEEPQELFRKDLGSFVRLYEFLSQIIPYNDPELEKLFVLRQALAAAAGGRQQGPPQARTGLGCPAHALPPAEGGRAAAGPGESEVVKLPGIGEAGTGSAPEDEKKALRDIVAKMNDLFSGHITESDFIGAVTAWQGHLQTNEKLAPRPATTAKSSSPWATSRTPSRTSSSRPRTPTTPSPTSCSRTSASSG
jgi:type I restriction enzyme R subunit